MRLEKIELIGFKSFADKTVFKFSAPVTCVVGPNGCGKSNIVDAFRWVMGEQSAKSMRGEKMVDVIFSGSQKRKPVNFAEVSLTFTDVRDSLNINFDEVCITRRLHRSGESEWFINKTSARLKDIHTLFWDTGLGRDAFCIFEQGKMDQLINSTSYERRYVFEEAAKIVGFKERKRDALKKLEKTDQNLKRVEDIHLEVLNQIETLNQQSKEASIYKEKKHDLEQIEKAYLSFQINQYVSDIEIKKTIHEEIKAEISSIENSLKTGEQQLITTKENTLIQENSLNLVTEKLFQRRSDKQVKLSELSSFDKMLDKLLSQKKSLKTKSFDIEEKLKEELKEYEQNRFIKAKKQKEIDYEEKIESTNDEKIEQLEKEVHEKRSIHKKIQDRYFLSLKEESSLDIQIKELQAKLESKKENLSKALKNQEHVIEKKKNNYALLQQKTKAIIKLEDELKNDTENLKRVKSKNEVLEVEIKESQDLFTTTERELSKVTARLSTFLRLKKDSEGCSKSAKALIEESKRPASPLYNKISPLFESLVAIKGYEEKLFLALWPYTQTLIVKTKSDLNKSLDFIEKKNLKDISLFCLENIQKASIDEKITLFCKETDLKSHFLSNISFVENSLDFLCDYKNSYIDAKSYVDSKGVLFFHPQKNKNLFQRESEIKKLQEEKEQIEKEKLSQSSSLLKINEKQLCIKKELDEIESQFREKKFQVNKENYAKEKLKEDSQSFDDELKNLENTSFILKNETKQDEKKLLNLSKLFSSAFLENNQTKSDFVAIDKEFENTLSILKEKRESKTKKQSHLKILREDIQVLLNNILVFESKKGELEEQIKFTNQNYSQTEEEIDKLLEQKKDLMTAESLCRSDLQKIEEEHTTLKDALSSLKENLKNKESSLSSLREQINQKKEEEVSLRLIISEKKAHLENFQKELLDRFEISDITDIDLSILSTVKNIEKHIKSLRRFLETHPEINLLAITECEKHRIREEFINRQVEDLTQAKSELLKIISHLDDKSREIFKDTFEKIRKSFRNNFETLFNGGEADLILQNENDVLESGIEIIAQPPGKQMRSIHLLSGGEKCLTAIALLFALFETQPIPFCLLDEIDAPLDDFNISKFTNVLKQFMKNNQFIIITHNKRTMAIADVLLGISMQEKGVSKVIPLAFESNKPEAIASIH